MTSLILPVYHVSEAHLSLTKACLESLRYGMPDEVIVVDDGSPIAIRDYPSYVTLVSRESNGGFPFAVNDGWAASTGDIIITSNNDIVFTPGWLEAIVLPLEKGYDISSIRTTDNSGYDTEDKITDGDKFGSLWAMRRAAYESIGGFDLRFGKGYFEDTDYRRRAMEAGFRVGKNHNHLVEHVGRATYDAIDPDRELYAKNIRVYAEKHGSVD